MARRKILISGAGVAGLTTALLLDPDKYEVTLVERANEYNSKGFAIILWKSGYDVVEQVLDDIELVKSEPLNVASFYGGNDLEFVHKTDISEVGHSVERKKLIEALAAQLPSKNNINVHLGAYITDIDKTPTENDVTLSNGTTGKYDLVILADGMHSVMRSKIFQTSVESEEYQLTYEWVYNCPKLKNEMIYGYMDNTAFLIQTVKDKALIGYYNKGHLEERTNIEKSIKSLIDNRAGGSCRIDRESAMDFSVETVRVKSAVSDTVVLVGDAFHGHSPTIAFGTSAALEDANLLAANLNSFELVDFKDQIGSSLAEYDKDRKNRVKKLYDFQDFAEKLVLSESHTHVELVKLLMKMGGTYPFEYWMLHLIKSGT